MNAIDIILTHARYNQWINQRLYDASERLSPQERQADQAAFFGSIQGTLNHLLIGDTIWLRRLLSADIPANELLAEDCLHWLPQPTRLDGVLFDQWDGLREMRNRVDAFIMQWTDVLTGDDLLYQLDYTNTRGRPFRRPVGLLLTHFFNHQTHHRGQVSTLLFQNGIDPGITDLLEILPNTLESND